MALRKKIDRGVVIGKPIAMNPAKAFMDAYDGLPQNLKDQLNRISGQFSRHKDVVKFISSFTGIRDGTEQKRRLLCYGVFKFISCWEVSCPKYFNCIWAYSNNPADAPIYLEGIIKGGDHVKLFRARKGDTGQRVVVKLYMSTQRDGTMRTTKFENDFYERLGKPRPCMSTDYFLWGIPVLVMEELQELTGADNEFEMAIQVIEQLKPLHKFGVHCDIKPGNVMRVPGVTPPQYLVIDYGGIATDKLEYGYDRWIWSPLWTSQKRRSEAGHRIICTPKHDMIELGYTMKTLQNMRRGIPTRKPKPGEADPVRMGFEGKLSKFMKRAFAIPEEAGITETDYAELIAILKCECQYCKAEAIAPIRVVNAMPKMPRGEPKIFMPTGPVPQLMTDEEPKGRHRRDGKVLMIKPRNLMTEESPKRKQRNPKKIFIAKEIPQLMTDSSSPKKKHRRHRK